jgi:hypothetical protein
VKRCNAENKKEKLAHLCSIVQGSFLELPFVANTFDGCYCIEAACHAPDPVELYTQVRAPSGACGAAPPKCMRVYGARCMLHARCMMHEGCRVHRPLWHPHLDHTHSQPGPWPMPATTLLPTALRLTRGAPLLSLAHRCTR